MIWGVSLLCVCTVSVSVCLCIKEGKRKRGRVIERKRKLCFGKNVRSTTTINKIVFKLRMAYKVYMIDKWYRIQNVTRSCYLTCVGDQWSARGRGRRRPRPRGRPRYSTVSRAPPASRQSRLPVNSMLYTLCLINNGTVSYGLRFVDAFWRQHSSWMKLLVQSLATDVWAHSDFHT